MSTLRYATRSEARDARLATYRAARAKRLGLSLEQYDQNQCLSCGALFVGRRWRYCEQHRDERGMRIRGKSLREIRAEMLGAQRGRCAICLRPQEKGVIDHDHRTLLIRGVLCGACNSGLGLFRDNPADLLAAVAYLNHHVGAGGLRPKHLRRSIRKPVGLSATK